MKFQRVLALGLILLAGVILFAPVWFSGGLLQVSDANVGHVSTVQNGLPTSYFGRWVEQPLLGQPSYIPLSVTSFLLLFLPAETVVNTVYWLTLAGASAFLVFLFGPQRKIVWQGLALAGLAAFWVGSNFTLLYAGHQGKFGVLLFFAASLFCIRRIRGRLSDGVLCGAAIGAMFMEQADMGMFCALFAGAYMLFRLCRAAGREWAKWFKVLLPAMAVALLFAAGPLLSGYKYHVKDASQVQTQSAKERWEYITQWSFPPEESIALIAPGYTGWRSGEPDGPYWGRMGRSAGWEQTRQGFMNFKLENCYIGLLPVVFALFALVACRRSKHKAEVMFWGGAALVALLLSFGKFTPLYALFYKLPIVNNVRNPNKFLQVFQVCLAVLTAYGFQELWKSDDVRKVRPFFWSLTGVSGLLILWTLGLTMGASDDVARFIAQGWPQEAAKTIVQNKAFALWHASVLAVVVTSFFALFSFPMFGNILKFKHWIAAGLVVLATGDAVLLSKHYVKSMPRSYIEANPLTGFLQENLGNQRVALLNQQGIYSVWLSSLFPCNDIQAFNVSQMPRMPQEYKDLLAAGSKNPLQMWRFASVKYLLGPTAVESQLKGAARKVFSYDVLPAGENKFCVAESITGAHSVFELAGSVPRYALISPPKETTIAAALSAPSPSLVGTADVLDRTASRVKLKTVSDEPSTLRVADRWVPGWEAVVDGVPAEVECVDGLCIGVPLPAGSHTVVLKYAPHKGFFVMQCAGYLVLFASLFAVILRRKRHEKA